MGEDFGRAGRYMKNEISIKYSISIAKPREAVWDFTQDYSLRTKWDNSILEANTLDTTAPNRVVKLRTKGKTTMTFVYKLDNKPHKTSLIASEIKSPLIESAGGSWTYEDRNDETLWTQTNTIRLKKNIFLPLLVPLFKKMFESQVRKAMKKAKVMMEMMD
jgi:hypothetical protein